jgi:hypothetical protein
MNPRLPPGHHEEFVRVAAAAPTRIDGAGRSNFERAKIPIKFARFRRICVREHGVDAAGPKANELVAEAILVDPREAA